MTRADVIRHGGRKPVRVAGTSADIPPDDRDAWLLHLRDWCRAQRGTWPLEEHAIRVRGRRTTFVHAVDGTTKE